MSNYLASKNQRMIDASIGYINRVIPAFQQVYDAIDQHGIQATIGEIFSLTYSYQNARKLNPKDFIINKLIDAAGEPEVAGIKISKSKLRDIMETPDISELEQAIEAAVFNQVPNGFKIILLTQQLEITDGTVLAKTDMETDIEAAYSYYTATDKGTNAAMKLKALCDALSDYTDTFAAQSTITAANVNIPGIDFSAGGPGKPGINVSFIKMYDK